MFRIWLFVVFAFLLLVAAWSTLIFVASKYSPERIEMNSSR